MFIFLRLCHVIHVLAYIVYQKKSVLGLLNSSVFPDGASCFSVDQGQLDPKHGTYRAFYSKTHGKNTVAADLEFKFVEEEGKKPKHIIAAAAGLLHQCDSGMKLKAKISSTGHVSGMIECPEGPAHSRVRASVQVDLRHLENAPKVGFSITSGPTK
jgi:hypothetical protein